MHRFILTALAVAVGGRSTGLGGVLRAAEAADRSSTAHQRRRRVHGRDDVRRQGRQRPVVAGDDLKLGYLPLRHCPKPNSPTLAFGPMMRPEGGSYDAEQVRGRNSQISSLTPEPRGWQKWRPSS